MAVRSPASNRTIATSRTIARDMGTSLQFNGTSDTVVTTTTSNPFTTGGSLVVWFNLQSLTANQAIMGNTLNNDGFTLIYRASGLRAEAGNGTNTVNTTGVTLVPNKWYLGVATFDGSDIRTYVNGVLIGSPVARTSIGNSLRAITFAKGAGGSFDYARATLASGSAYSRALSATEVSNLYFNNITPRDGLVGEWLFNEGSGTTALDTSGNGNTGTITGATYSQNVPFTNRVATRDMGTALDTFASSGYVIIGISLNASLNAANAYTIAQWVKRSPVQGTLQSFAGVPAADKAWFNFMADNAIRLYNADLTPPDATTITRKITDQNWHLIVGTFDGTTRRIYVDSLAQTLNNPTSTGNLNLNNTFYVTAFAGGNNFRGKVDEPRIWNRALTATEIKNLYLNNIVPREGLVAEYLFNETTGSTALDTSGNGNNGTITGATYTLDVPLKLRTEA